MRRRLAEHAIFFREFLHNFHTTGAILPSGRSLSAALTRFVREPSAAARRILEVGPGTGAVTRRIVAGMGPRDSLDLVELNDSFVERLRHRFESEPEFQAVADACAGVALPDRRPAARARLRPDRLRLAAEQLFTCPSGGHSRERWAACRPPSGMLSFFEYIAVRPDRAMRQRSARTLRVCAASAAL